MPNIRVSSYKLLLSRLPQRRQPPEHGAFPDALGFCHSPHILIRHLLQRLISEPLPAPLLLAGTLVGLPVPHDADREGAGGALLVDGAPVPVVAANIVLVTVLRAVVREPVLMVKLRWRLVHRSGARQMGDVAAHCA